jgi:hypothetical protein
MPNIIELRGNEINFSLTPDEVADIIHGNFNSLLDDIFLELGEIKSNGYNFYKPVLVSNPE